jgi:hypothetical protein
MRRKLDVLVFSCSATNHTQGFALPGKHFTTEYIPSPEHYVLDLLLARPLQQPTTTTKIK